MTHPIRREASGVFPARAALACSISLLVLALSVRSAPCQDNPFDDTTSAPSGAVASGAARGDVQEEDEQAKAAREYQEKVAAETDPLVRAILDSPPETPAAWIRDAQSLLNLQRMEFAREYLRQFLSLTPEATQLVDVYERYGSALMLRFSRIAELQPEGAAVAEMVLRAADEWTRDATRLAELVDRLDDPDAATRRLALAQLVAAAPDSAIPLIAVLADSNRAAEHELARAALVALGDQAAPPLLAALDSSHDALRIEVLHVLRSLKLRETVGPVLAIALAEPPDPAQEAARALLVEVLGQLPSRQEAIKYLTVRLESYLEGMNPGPVDEHNQAILWKWDADGQVPRRVRLPAADASFYAAAELAEQRHALEPTSADFERTFLLLGLEAAKRINDYDQPLKPELSAACSRAVTADLAMLEEVLERAIPEGLEGAAAAVLELLGQRGDSTLLQSTNGQPRLLAQALHSAMPRVKFAAAQAVMRIDPTQSYAGSSFLPEALVYLASSGGQRRALIGHPRADEGQRLASLWTSLGFAADTQQTGRELALQAFSSPDYSLIVVHEAIDRPPYRELIQILRRDPRAASLPVGVIVREDERDEARWLAKTDPLTLLLAPPLQVEDAAQDTRRLLEAAGRRQLPPEQRMLQATFALDALAQLAGNLEKYPFYDLLTYDRQLEQVLNAPVFSAAAARVLGLLGTPRAQQALVQLASTPTQPLAARQAAAAAFRTAVLSRGLLLTRDLLLRQYDIYNASESLDRETQEVLAALLDTMETPSRNSAPSPQED